MLKSDALNAQLRFNTFLKFSVQNSKYPRDFWPWDALVYLADYNFTKYVGPSVDILTYRQPIKKGFSCDFVFLGGSFHPISPERLRSRISHKDMFVPNTKEVY